MKAWIKRLIRLPLLQNLTWMMVSEVLSRASRIVTLFVLATYFSNSDYGLAMLALVIHEVMRVFTRLGTGAKIIQCKNSELQDILQNAATLQWAVVIVVSALQIALAESIAQYYEQEQLGQLLKLMALAHLFYPLVTVRIFEQQRQNKLRFYGIASGCCIAFENLLIALLVFCDVSIFAVAWAKVAASIFWVICFYRLPSQLNTYRWQWPVQKNLATFSLKTLVSELNRTLRFQADSLFAGKLLSPEEFGIYSFAKSAGLGIAQSISTAYMATLYPHLCGIYRNNEHQNTQPGKQVWRITFFIAVMFIAQAFMAQFYISMLFSERWVEATNLVSLLCIVAIPTLLIDHYGLTFRAQNNPMFEMKLVMTCTIALFTSLAIMKPDSGYETAYVLLACSFGWCLLLLWRPTQHLRINTLRPKTL